MENKREVLPLETEVVFDYEVSMKGEMVSSITINKPTMKNMKDMAKIKGSDLDKEAWLISCLSGMPVSDIDNLHTDQYELVQDVVGKYTSSNTKSS